MNTFLGADAQFTGYDQSKYVIVPLPFEHSTSYVKGTGNGPQAILAASAYVELYDEEFNCESYRRGIHTLDAPPVSESLEKSFVHITETVLRALRAGKFAVGLGGEHSVSFPVYRAYDEVFDDLSILQLDAHSDLRYTYENTIYSHAAVMHRIYELNQNIVLVGTRSQCAEEARFIAEKGICVFYAHYLHQQGFRDDIIHHLKKNVYITFDVDFFDPALMPATGTPEPGGFFWPETIEFLNRVFQQRNVVGFDVVELSPIKNLVHADFTIAKLVYKMITMHDVYNSCKNE